MLHALPVDAPVPLKRHPGPMQDKKRVSKIRNAMTGRKLGEALSSLDLTRANSASKLQSRNLIRVLDTLNNHVVKFVNNLFPVWQVHIFNKYLPLAHRRLELRSPPVQPGHVVGVAHLLRSDMLDTEHTLAVCRPLNRVELGQGIEVESEVGVVGNLVEVEAQDCTWDLAAGARVGFAGSHCSFHSKSCWRERECLSKTGPCF